MPHPPERDLRDTIVQHLAAAGGKPTMVFVAPGPNFYLEASFRARCELLSKGYCGIVLTGSARNFVEQYGDFLVVALEMTGNKSKLALSFDTLLLIRSVIRRLNSIEKTIDVVVAYDPLITGFVAHRISRWAGAALVIEVNGCFGDPFNYADIASALKRRLKQFIYPRFATMMLKRADGIKLLFPEQLAFARGVSTDVAIKAFPSLIDLETFRYVKDDKEILFVGYPFWLKGVDLLVQAFHDIKKEFPDWRLTILGHFRDRTELNRCVRGEPRIIIRPPVRHDKIFSIIGSCGVFVLPSRVEGMGRVLVEAASAGKARVGARVGGIPTVITDGEDGLLFEPGNADDLAEKLRCLLKDPKLRARIGKNARQRAERDFSSDGWWLNAQSLYLAARQRAQVLRTEGGDGVRNT
jgi:glycosyltransferase involved in cell wall biosynthesis